MSTLRKIVEKKKSEKYAWPTGWMTREQAANDLGVAPRDVDDTLKEAIRDGDVLKQHFPLWDVSQGRVVRHPGYRVADKSAAPVPEKPRPEKTSSRGLTMDERILAAILKYPHKTDREIAKNVFGSRSADVAAVRQASM